MTTLQKTVIGAALAAAVGTGIYEALQASRLRTEVQTLQQQRAPLAEQIQQLQRERDAALSAATQNTNDLEFHCCASDALCVAGPFKPINTTGPTNKPRPKAVPRTAA